MLSISIAHLSVVEKEGDSAGKLMAELKENINRPLAAILTINTIANTVGAAGVGAQTQIIYGNRMGGSCISYFDTLHTNIF